MLIDPLEEMTRELELPAGCDQWGMLALRPDMTTTNGSRPTPGNPLPASCEPPTVAKTWHGLSWYEGSANTVVLAAYSESDVIETNLTYDSYWVEMDRLHTVTVGTVQVVKILSGAEVLRDHGQKADLCGAALQAMDLSDVDLTGADLTGADLERSCLQRSNLSNTLLVDTCARQAQFGAANLTGARLDNSRAPGADLSFADLRGAKMRGTVLVGACLAFSDLRGADLSGVFAAMATFRGADLTGANLDGGHLTGANFQDAKGI